jgi:hypothetical protein
MTVTISRLYDNHDDAQQAVRRLESAGVPHSDISMVANNSDSWFNTGVMPVSRARRMKAAGSDGKRASPRQAIHGCVAA